MNKFDQPSFYAGTVIGILLLAGMIGCNRLVGDYHTITVPDICNYEEDNCYPDYNSDGWRIVEGERQ